jgi:hypothetical protein
MTESSISSNHSEQTIRLAMLGMIPGNGHSWSWSAIVNGYDPENVIGEVDAVIISTDDGMDPEDFLGQA